MKVLTVEDAKELEAQLSSRGYKMVYATLDEVAETHPYKVSLLDSEGDEMFSVKLATSPLDAVKYFAKCKRVREALAGKVGEE
jgi:hypothetical protein